ncbi:MAG: glycosyltransferase family 9 protein [Nitrospinales bacterium]
MSVRQTLTVKLLVSIFRRIRLRSGPAKLPRNLSRVAVACTGGVGDILLCTPAIRAIKEIYPQCRLTAIVNYKRTDMLRFNPWIDELLPFRKSPFHCAKILRRLKAEPPEVVLLFSTNDPYMYALSALACPGGLVGYQGKNPLAFLLGKSIAFEDRFHVIRNNLNLVSMIGARTENMEMNLRLGKEVEGAADFFLNRSDETRYRVGFQLGSGFVKKCWPISKYAELGNRLMDRLNARIVLLASPREKTLANELNQALNGRAVPAITDLLTAGEIIRNLDLLVTPDTGPMHMAFALQCPTVALFGPSHPKNYGYLGSSARHVIIHKPPFDGPYVKLSRGYEDLMDRISPDEVFDAAVELLTTHPKNKGK